MSSHSYSETIGTLEKTNSERSAESLSLHSLRRLNSTRNPLSLLFLRTLHLDHNLLRFIELL